MTQVPPHANAEPHRGLMKRLSRMSPEEIFKSAVRAGIYTPEGKLKAPYAPVPKSTHKRRSR